MTLAMVSERTGVSRSQISLVENGKVDPRMSTIEKLVDCYGASLGDLSSRASRTYTIDDLMAGAEAGSARLAAAGIGPSDPYARLDLKDQQGSDTTNERRSLASRT